MNTVEERRRVAAARAKRVAALRAARGVRVQIVGSLARGDFGAYSDVDFLVTSSPMSLRYAIEGKVEDQMRDIPFSVLYLDEALPLRRQVLEAVDADTIDVGTQPA